MAAIGGDIDVSNTPVTGNYPAFDLYPQNHTPNPLYGSNNDQQHQLALMKQQLILQQQMSQPENKIGAPAVTNSYPTKKSFSQATPEKQNLSQSPPSPADSGVVTDAKLDGINISQDLIQSIETSKSDEDFPSKSPTLAFGASPDLTDSNLLSFSSDAPVMNSFGLSAPASSISAEIGISSSGDLDSNANHIPQNLAAIWSAPTTNSFTSPASENIDEILLQQLQQQQQLSNWSNPGMMNGFANGGLPSPPPGLYNNAQMNVQQQNTAAQIQVLQQQLALRRSQSNMMRQANSFNRSTSHQPGFMGGVAMNGHKLNNFPPSPKSGSYSSWSNGQTSLSSAWPTSTARTPSLFNSLQHSANSANRMLNGQTAFRKQSLGGQIPSPPRLGRSMSTPAKYGNYNGGLGSLDDNKFFKMADGQNGMMPFNDSTGSDNMSMMSIESQLFDILRSNEQQQQRAQNFPRSTGKWPDMGGDVLLEESFNQMPFLSDFPPQERFSRKVFVGGLPPDIDEEEITASFRHFGALVVDWPHKAESKSYFPPKGYAFLLFQDEISVQTLISCCMKDGDKLYIRVSSPTIREKAVQIRPWNLADSDFVLDGSQPLDPRKTIFVGGVPRPLRAVELAMIMDRLYGGVCYAGIDVDPELKYPKGAGRVAFSNQQSYIAAISARFVQLQLGDIDKRVEVKPYVLDDQHCDECQGSRCGGKFAPFFCANVTCLQYYCETCWASIHARPGREFHKPLVKEGADRSPRSMPFRW